jgi:hypothetical protein
MLAMKMDKGRNADQGRDRIFAAVAIVVLLALTVTSWTAAGLPQALETAASAANGSGAITHNPELDGERPYPRDIEEEHPEPPLAGALRAEGPTST